MKESLGRTISGLPFVRGNFTPLKQELARVELQAFQIPTRVGRKTSLSKALSLGSHLACSASKILLASHVIQTAAW